MNDDFLKNHQQQPDSGFVDNLQNRLERQSLRDQRLMKFSRTLISGLATITLVVAMLAVVSPTARAAFGEFLLSFNGVNVYRNTETGKLETEGNLDAVVIQEDHIIGIESDDRTELEVVADLDIEASQMPVDELLERYPDFILPINLPDGYDLDPMGFYLSDDHGLTVIWTNSNGDYISLTRTKMLQPELPEPEDGTVVEVIVTMDTGYEVKESSSTGDQYAEYSWVDADNHYHYLLTASDETISEQELTAIVE